MSDIAVTGTFRAALSHRDLRLVLIGSGVSFAGDWMYGVSLLAYVYEETRSPAWVAAAGVLRMVPYLVLGTFGGVIADRYERRSVLMASDATRAVLMFALALLAAQSGPVTAAIALVMASAAAATPASSALAAMTPSLVGEEDLAAANSAMSLIDNIGLALGPAVGGVLLYASSPAVAFALNGATFLVSLALMALVRRRSSATQASRASPLAARLAEGIKAVTSSADILMLMAVSFASAMLYGQENVLLVVVSQRSLELGSEGVGFLFAAIGVGGLAGAAVSNRLAQDPHPGRTLALTLVLSGAALMALAFTTSPLVAYVSLTLDGAGAVILDVVAVTMLQRTVSQDVMARVFGIDMTISVGATLLGSMIAPVTLRWLGLRGALLLAGATLPILALVAAPRLRALTARANATRARLEPLVDALAELPVFHGAPRRSLELLAAYAHDEHVPAGQHVLSEGEPADDFFIVRSGSLSVLSSGERGGRAREVNTMGHGDYFGEIGLIERMPRTASVKALTDCELLRIPGERFLYALEQAPTLSPALVTGLVGRLARTHPSYRSSTATVRGGA